VAVPFVCTQAPANPESHRLEQPGTIGRNTRADLSVIHHYMSKSKWLVISAIAACTAGGLSGSHAQAAESSENPAPARQQWLERARERLGLTDEQVAQIKTALQGEAGTAKDLIARLHDARTGLREAIHSADGSEAAVRTAAAKVAAVEADLAVERFKLYGKIRPILTAEQRDQVKQVQSKLDDFLDGAILRLSERASDK
jgi:Spy/CpxP family protein refolding chaperone